LSSTSDNCHFVAEVTSIGLQKPQLGSRCLPSSWTGGSGTAKLQVDAEMVMETIRFNVRMQDHFYRRSGDLADRGII